MADNLGKRTLASVEAARYIGMSDSWLRQARMRGATDTPPHLKIGRSVRYLRDDLDKWLAASRLAFGRTTSI